MKRCEVCDWPLSLLSGGWRCTNESNHDEGETMSDEPTIDDLETAMSVLLWLHIEEDNGLLRDHISIVRSALDSIITAREGALGVVWPATSDKAGVRQVDEGRLLAEEGT